jgi:hypothetical protein
MSNFLDHLSQRVLLCDGASRRRRAEQIKSNRAIAQRALA